MADESVGGEQEIIELFDIPKAQADAEKYYAIIQEVDERIRKVAGISLAKNGDAGQFRQQTEEMKTAMQQIADMQKKLIGLEEQLAAARKSNSTKTRTDDEIRASVQARNEMKARTDAIKAENDAYKQLALAYNQAAAEAKKLQAVALKSGSQSDKDAANAATANAKGMSDQLKNIDHPVGDDRRNVGNYMEAVQSLKPALQSVKAQLDAMRESGQQNTQEFQKLHEQFSALTTITSRQSEGFASVTQQLRFMERALQTMREAGLKGTQAFREMQLETANARKEFNEFANAEKILSSGAPILTSLTVAAKGLAGAYAIGAGTTALLANGNEKVEKELNKLVAVMTVLQGLQEVHELLMKRGAIVVAFTAAAEKIRNFVLTGSTTAIREKTVAETVNTEVELTNTEATEANTIATEEQAVAQDAVTVAVEESTGAMVALRFAFIASGIGVLLLLLPLVAKGFGLFAKDAKEAAKEALELEEAIDKLNETISNRADIENRYLQEQREGLQENLASTEKAGKNYYELFAIRKRLAEVDQQEAEHLLLRASKQNDIRTAVRKTTDEIESQKSSLDGMLLVQETLQKSFIDGYAKRSLTERKVGQEELDSYQKSIDIAKKRLEVKSKLLDDYNAKVAANENMEIELEKFTADERRTLDLAIVKAKAEGHIAANQRIVNDERSTQAQIMAAMDAGLHQQLTIIASQKKALAEQLQRKEITPDNFALQNTELNATAKGLTDDNTEAKRRKNEEYFKRYLAAVNDVNKSALDTESKTAEAASNNVKLSLDQRLAAYQEYVLKQQALINLEAGMQKQVAGLTSEELFDIEVKRQQRLQDLYVAGQAKQASIILSSIEKQKDKLINQADIEGLKGEIKAYEELNQKLRSAEITIDAYNRAKDKIANNASTQALQMQTVTLEYISGLYKQNGLDATAVDKQVYENKKHLTQLEIADAVKAAELKKELKEKEVELAKASTDLIGDFIKGGYEKEIDRYNGRIAANNLLKEEETARITGSTQQESLKAAELQRLALSTTEKNAQLEKQKRDAKTREAHFDRDKAIFDIGANTGIAIMKAVAEFPLTAGEPWAAIAAAMGAIQIASILAKPIPKYEMGTDFAPGGLAKVHPGEIRVNPDGKMTKTPDWGESLTFLERGTKIIPRHRANAYLMDGIFTPSAPAPQDDSLIRELQGLKSVYIAGSNAQVAAIQKIKAPQNHIHIEAGILVRIKNSM